MFLDSSDSIPSLTSNRLPFSKTAHPAIIPSKSLLGNIVPLKIVHGSWRLEHPSRMKESSEVFAGNLRRYRSIRGMSQSQLAELAGISNNFLSQVEGGKKFPSPKVMDRLALALKVQPFELFIDLESLGSVDGALVSTVKAFLEDIASQVSAFSSTLK